MNHATRHAPHDQCNGQRKRVEPCRAESQRLRQRNGSRVASNNINDAEQNGVDYDANYVDNDIDNNDVDDPLANVLSLKLKKPKGWQWELSTSRSCSNIALPRILLYDHKGQLLVDADSQQEQVFKPKQVHRQPQAVGERKTQRKISSRAATTELETAIRRALEREFDGLQIAEATPSPEPTETWRQAAHRSRRRSPASIELQSTQLPGERRALSCKEVRFKEADEEESTQIDTRMHIIDLPTPPSSTSRTTPTTTTTTTTTTNSTSSGTREKRRYRRAHSSLPHSESILERFSFNRGRFSSPEYAAEHEVSHGPRYFLRTSKAGTLVVQEESFSRQRRRRKLRNSSTENMLHEGKSRSTSCLKSPSNNINFTAASRTTSMNGVERQLQLPPERTRKKLLPVRRYRSDGNMLLQRQMSSSDTELENVTRDGRTLRKYSDYRRQRLVTIDPANGILRAVEKQPAR